MSTAEKALAQRIRELRRRHFGARGKGEFAERLGVAAEEYERYERDRIPDGAMLVKMCEFTGEDLQWLLTGVAARGTMIIAGARGRHQALLAKVARLIEEHPAFAAPIEAFADLLAHGGERATRALPHAVAAATPRLISVVSIDALNDELPRPLAPAGAQSAYPALPGDDDGPADDPGGGAKRLPASLFTPAIGYADKPAGRATIVALANETGALSEFVEPDDEALELPPATLAVRLIDDSMSSMFQAGDLLIVALASAAAVGRPALCKFRGRTACCRIWLGEEGGVVHLGRLDSGAQEDLPRRDLRWSLEVLYRLAPAA